MMSMVCARTLPGLLTIGALAPIAIAQTTAGNSFDVVSVKTGGDPSSGMSMQTTPSSFSVSNVTLKYLIQFAWDVKSFQISGGPGWIGSDRFTIHAKSEHRMEADITEQLHSRVRLLLADRFELRLPEEERVMPVYELVAAGTGSKLSPAKNGESEGWYSGSGILKGTRVRTGTIARALSDPTGRLVIDQTDLNGYYDCLLTWALDSTTGAEPHLSEQAAGPSLFTTVQEQLGLRLKAAKGPVEMLVIDKAEKPSAN